MQISCKWLIRRELQNLPGWRLKCELETCAHPAGRQTVNHMEPMFDIFATLPDGSPLWLESVEGLDEAKERLSGLVRARPGRYFIYSERTGGVVERVPRDPDIIPPVHKTHFN